MASNFQLLSYRNKDSLHLQLYGDFDGNSAYELINTLKKMVRILFKFLSIPMTSPNYTPLDLMYFKIITPSQKNATA